METHLLVGNAAGILGIISFLPQLIKSWKSKSTHDLSWGWLILFSASLSLWLLYGIILGQFPIIMTNTLILSLLAVIFYLKVKYR